ncbi:MAG: type II secretion system protein GspH [Deltaproteobacteria bacterium]|nr:type II secretion system protein GspH [Deltaproteobacteria bacterium]
MRKGFTLVELIIVIIILSISIALVSPSLLRLSKTAELRSTAQKIAAILRNSRSEAVNKGRIYQILFHTELREVKVRWMKANEEESEGEEKKERPSTPAYAFPEGIFIKEVELKGTQYDSELPAIEFYPNGGSNGGSFLLEAEDRKGYRIKVHFLTGMVEIIKV